MTGFVKVSVAIKPPGMIAILVAQNALSMLTTGSKSGKATGSVSGLRPSPRAITEALR